MNLYIYTIIIPSKCTEKDFLEMKSDIIEAKETKMMYVIPKGRFKQPLYRTNIRKDEIGSMFLGYQSLATVLDRNDPNRALEAFKKWIERDTGNAQYRIQKEQERIILNDWISREISGWAEKEDAENMPRVHPGRSTESPGGDEGY